MQIAREDAVKLFVSLGLRNADKWSDERMASKLAILNEMVDDDVELEDKESEILLYKVLQANDSEEEIEVVDAVPANEEAQDSPAEVEQATDFTEEELQASDSEDAGPIEEQGAQDVPQVTNWEEDDAAVSEGQEESTESSSVEKPKSKAKGGRKKRKAAKKTVKKRSAAKSYGRAEAVGRALAKLGKDEITAEHYAFVEQLCGPSAKTWLRQLFGVAKKVIDGYLSDV